MVGGREVIGEIESWLAKAREEFERLSNDLDAANREREHLDLEELETLCALARVRLELTSSDVGDACDSALRRLRAQLADQDERRQSLRAELARNTAERDQLSPQRECLALQRDAALDALRECARGVRDRILGNAEIMSNRDRMKALVSKAAHAATKAAQAGRDRDAKRRAYEADPLFAYLWQRRFATPEYRASSLVRTLDGWVAGHIGYEEAHRNYELLLEIPTRLEQHAASLREQAARTRDGLRREVMAVFAEHGIPALVRDVDAARKRLAEVDARLDGLDEERSQLERTLAELIATRDARTQDAVEGAARELRGIGSDGLTIAARTTESARDDDIVARVTDIRDRCARAMACARSRAEDRAAAEVAVRHGREIVRRFRAEGLELRDFGFSEPAEVRDLYGMITSATADLECAWSWLVNHVVGRRGGSTWTDPSSDGDDWIDLLGRFCGGGFSDPGDGGGAFGLDDFIGGIFGGDGFDTGDSF